MIKVYLASGWFSYKQAVQMKEIYEVLNRLKTEGMIELFAPYYNGIVLRKTDPYLREKMREVWDLDIKKVVESDLIVASTQDHDVGTIFECGYASAYKKIIFCYNSNPELGLNVMLAQEARAFIKTQEKLEEAVKSFSDYMYIGKNPLFFRYNLWEGEPI